MATFPHWHRLYVVQFEQLLVQHGLANIGVPYWDWTEPITSIPELVKVSGPGQGHRGLCVFVCGVGAERWWGLVDVCV
jgi:hypothetical protein